MIISMKMDLRKSNTPERSEPEVLREARTCFKLSYFHKPAVLAQSPQFYKQMMVGVFDRVFETGPVFRAEKHNTKRHLNEYTSLDFEMGYIDSFEEIMAMETGFLQYAIRSFKRGLCKRTGDPEG